MEETLAERHKKGFLELEVLDMMFQRWLKSDVVWALKQNRTYEEDEWDFLKQDWLEKFWDWMYPFVDRLYKTDYISRDTKEGFIGECYYHMNIMLELLYKIGGGSDG